MCVLVKTFYKHLKHCVLHIRKELTVFLVYNAARWFHDEKGRYFIGVSYPSTSMVTED
jgi:hypothetical protein